MNIEKTIENATLKQIVIVALIMAFLFLAWRNKELIRAKIEGAKYVE